MTVMTIVIVGAVALLIGLGIGYAVGHECGKDEVYEQLDREMRRQGGRRWAI